MHEYAGTYVTTRDASTLSTLRMVSIKITQMTE
jgi:hypothetical protein